MYGSVYLDCPDSDGGRFSYYAGPVYLYGIHTVRAALDNPRRLKRELLITPNALMRLKEPINVFLHIRQQKGIAKVGQTRSEIVARGLWCAATSIHQATGNKRRHTEFPADSQSKLGFIMRQFPSPVVHQQLLSIFAARHPKRNSELPRNVTAFGRGLVITPNFARLRLRAESPSNMYDPDQ